MLLFLLLFKFEVYMKPILKTLKFLLIVFFILLFSSCTTKELISVKTPNIINPVTLSPRVAIGNGKQPQNVGNFESVVKGDKFTFALFKTTKETSALEDNFENEILNVTRGRKDMAINNVVIEVERGGLIFLPFLMWGDSIKADIKGEVLLLEE